MAMTAAELIDALQKMPPDAEVVHLWDGAPRTEVNIVYLSRSGKVVTSDYGMVCYHTIDRPESAPTMEHVSYWETEGDPDGE